MKSVCILPDSAFLEFMAIFQGNPNETLETPIIRNNNAVYAETSSIKEETGDRTFFQFAFYDNAENESYSVFRSTNMGKPQDISKNFNNFMFNANKGVRPTDCEPENS